MKKVIIALTLTDLQVAAGTVPGAYAYTLSGRPTETSNETTFTFSDVEPGNYDISVQRLDSAGQPLGVAITGQVTVSADDVPADMITISVPAGISVSVQ